MRLSSLILLLGTSSIAWARVAPAEAAITPAPSLVEVELRRRQGSVDLASILPVLETAVPPSILALALTNVPAVSRLLWSEFLDDNTPSWFAALPTNIQEYLSGEFGPTTTSSHRTSSTAAPSSTSSSATVSSTSSAPTVSQTATANQSQSQSSNSHHHGGLPLWAKILIGILVPLVVLGLLALLLLCCLRRRRSRRHAQHTNVESRAPTPAFISSSYPRRDVPDHHHVPLRGGYHSAPTSDGHTPVSSNHVSSDSGDFHTPIGGPSYENLAAPVVPAAAAAGGLHHSRRGSRQSLSSLHSVPEVPEPINRTNQQHITGAMAIPPPPRSPRRSRDMSQEFAAANVPAQTKNDRRISPLNPAYSNNAVGREMGAHPYYNQGVYATGGPYDPEDFNNNRVSDPFTDPSPPTNFGHSGGVGAGGYLPNHQVYPTAHQSYPPAQQGYPPAHQGRHEDTRRDDEYDWPLRSPQGYGHHYNSRHSWEQGDDRQQYYEM